MKKVLSIIACLCFIGTSFAQTAGSTTPRYTNNWAGYIVGLQTSIADTAGSTEDTIGLRPKSYLATYTLTVTDSVALKIASNGGAYDGDKLILNIKTPTSFAGVLYLAYSHFVVSTGTARIALTANKRGKLIFQYDAVANKWIEISRNLNY